MNKAAHEKKFRTLAVTQNQVIFNEEYREEFPEDSHQNHHSNHHNHHSQPARHNNQHHRQMCFNNYNIHTHIEQQPSHNHQEQHYTNFPSSLDWANLFQTLSIVSQDLQTLTKAINITNEKLDKLATNTNDNYDIYNNMQHKLYNTTPISWAAEAKPNYFSQFVCRHLLTETSDRKGIDFGFH